MEDNKDQIAEQTEIPVSEIASEQKKLRIKPSFVIFIPVMLVLIILAVAAWYFTLRSSEDPLLATVAKVSDTSITQKDVVEEYNKRYSAATPIASFRDIKDEARTELIDSMVERLILEKEAVVYCSSNDLEKVKEGLSKKGLKIVEVKLSRKPISSVKIDDEKTADQVLSLVNKLEDLQDIQTVYSNFDISEEILERNANIMK